MADTNEQPNERPEYPGDQVAQDLADKVRANEALLNGLKYDIGQRVAAAAEGGGEFPGGHELLAMKKLEAQIENDKAYLRLRTLTRKRRAE